MTKAYGYVVGRPTNLQTIEDFETEASSTEASSTEAPVE